MSKKALGILIAAVVAIGGGAAAIAASSGGGDSNVHKMSNGQPMTGDSMSGMQGSDK